MTTILLRWTRNPHHYHVRVFMGPDRDHLALVGELCMLPLEACRFRETVRRGICPDGIRGIFEKGWGDRDESGDQ